MDQLKFTQIVYNNFHINYIETMIGATIETVAQLFKLLCTKHFANKIHKRNHKNIKA